MYRPIQGHSGIHRALRISLFTPGFHYRVWFRLDLEDLVFYWDTVFFFRDDKMLLYLMKYDQT